MRDGEEEVTSLGVFLQVLFPPEIVLAVETERVSYESLLSFLDFGGVAKLRKLVRVG